MARRFRGEKTIVEYISVPGNGAGKKSLGISGGEDCNFQLSPIFLFLEILGNDNNFQIYLHYWKFLFRGIRS